MKKYALYFAWLCSLIGMLLSLYLSEVLHWPICALCWYQRVCLYPLVLLLGMGCFQDDRRIAHYALPLTLLGAVFAMYQYLEQMWPGFAPIDVCGSGPSCRHIDAMWFGFVTLPLVSLVGFLMISGFLFMCRKN